MVCGRPADEQPAYGPGKCVRRADAQAEDNESVFGVASGFGGVVPVIERFKNGAKQTNQQRDGGDELRGPTKHPVKNTTSTL